MKKEPRRSGVQVRHLQCSQKNSPQRYPVMKAPAKNAPNHTDQSTYALRNML